MPTTTITFEEPNLVQGWPIPSITKDGTTVTFLTRVSIFRPDVTTESAPNALMNAGQDINDETGWQKPIIFEFSRLQRRVRIMAGLNERDISLGGGITAHLVAYDSSGNEVNSTRALLGTGPTPINVPLEIQASGDVIRRILLEYNGNVREVIDNLEFESQRSTPIPPDIDPPIVRILRPTEGQQVNSRTILVSGTIREVNGLALTINGTSVPIQRIDANQYFFNAEVTLPEGTNSIEAVATDEFHNTGRDRKTVDIRVPTRFLVSDVRFTQSGLLDSGDPLPTRRVARKTSLFRLRLEIHSADGRPTSVDDATIVLEGGTASQYFRGQPYPFDNQFRWGSQPISNNQEAYFFINGRWLEPETPYRFVLRLSVGQQLVFQQNLAANWSFRSIYGITMLLVPQNRALDDTYIR